MKNYHLAEALGNTFVLFDCLDGSSFDPAEVLHALLEEGRDDALILVKDQEKGKTLYLEMKVLGADGLYGEFCGNGSRAVAHYLYMHYPEYDDFYLVTSLGTHRLLKWEGRYATHLPRAQFHPSKTLYFEGKLLIYGEAIEPHLVCLGALTDAELTDLGRKLNANKELFPTGINVNSWHVIADGEIFVKTYERGVQRLTRSCGSGSIVCACFYRWNKGQVKVETPGGILEIALQKAGLYLIGPATLVKDLKGEF